MASFVPRGGLPIFCLWVFFICLLAVSPAAAEEAKKDGLPEVVARVNGVDIEGKLVRFQLNRLMRATGRPIKEEQKRQVVLGIIDKEVVRELVYQEGKAKNLSVDQALVDKELEMVREPYPSEEVFESALAERNLTLDELKESIQVDLIAKQLLDEQVKGKIHITNEDVKQYYEKNKQQFFRPQAFHARHIFISVFPPELLKDKEPFELQEQEASLRKKAEKKVEQIEKELKEGADFAELAKKHSHDAASAENGGDLDFMYMGVFDPAFDEAVAKLKPGETSGIVKTDFGFHIIQLIETQPPEQAPFSEMEPGIQKHLFMEQAQALVQNYLAGLKKQAKIEILF